MAGRRQVGEVVPVRPLPFLDPDNTFFWTGGADGVLRILRCDNCGYWVHPVAPVCRRCGSLSLTPTATGGRGAIVGWTLNVHPWQAGAEPYLIANVELREQPALVLTTNLVDCEDTEVRVGAAVSVVFERCGDVWLPLFRLDRDDG